MTYGIGARQDFKAYHHKNSSRKSLSQSVFGGAALACIVLGCGWTLATNVLGTGVDPAAVGANVEPVIGAVTFSARFDALGAGTEGLSVVRKSAPAVRQASDTIRKNYMALLDVTYSLGQPPGSFSATMPRGPDRQLAMLSPDQSGAEDVAPTLAQRAVESVPLPASRPSTLRLLASREVAKAKAAIMAVTSSEKPTIFEKLYGKPQAKGSLLAFASADFSDVSIPNPAKASAMGNAAPYDRQTAVYDITARAVYLPDGTKLEAHSGLGSKLDDPRYVHVRMHGATPPHVYDLEPREALFHGVPALRLKPVGGEEAIFGRTGLLAHTYMLGPNGDSNGCVSFKDYYAFLNAYRNGGIKRLAVVAKVE
jgi:type VI secretion system (T6SS) effector TldE1-like protein